MSKLRKACPIVLRKAPAGNLEILAFRHPLAGTQLVKGTIESAESIHRAAERELYEESGLIAATTTYLGSAQMSDAQQEWHFAVCDARLPPEYWTHRTSDGGGLDFEFFWHPLDQEPDETWLTVFKEALSFIRRRVRAVTLKWP